MGFTRETVVPWKVMESVQNFVKRVYINGQQGVKSALFKALAAHSKDLEHSAAILICREAGSDDITSIEIGLDAPTSALWGLPLPRCNSLSCRSAGAAALTPRKPNGKPALVKFMCRACHFQSGFIKRAEWIVPVDGHPSIYYHNFPLSEEQQDWLQRMANSARPSSAAQADLMKMRGKKSL